MYDSLDVFERFFLSLLKRSCNIAEFSFIFLVKINFIMKMLPF